MSHYRRDVVGRGISTGLGLGLRRRLSGGALPALLSWKFGSAEDPPATSAFARTSSSYVRTTTDGTAFWYQATKDDELPIDGLRRSGNLTTFGDADDWGGNSGVTKSGDEFTYPGSSGAERAQISSVGPFDNGQVGGISVELSTTTGTADLELRIFGLDNIIDQEITITTTPQTFFVRGVPNDPGTTGNIGMRLQNTHTNGVIATTIVIGDTNVYYVQTATSPPEPYVDPAVVSNAEVAGVRYFNTDNGNSVDGSGVVTEAAGTTITGGGYLPEPAATNVLTQSEDLSDAAWGNTGITTSDQGVSDIGLRTWRFDAGTGTSAHVIFQSPAGTGDLTVSVRAKAVTGRYACMHCGGDGANNFGIFDLVAGTITETGSSATTRIKDLSGGWYQCDITVGSAANLQLVFGISDVATPGDGQPSFTGANETIDFAIPNDENTAFSTSPIITSGSTVTRVVDRLSDATIPAESSGVFDVTMPVSQPSGNAITVLCYGDTVGFAAIFLVVSPNDRLVLQNNAVVAIADTAATPYENERHKFAYSLKEDEGIVVDDEGNDGSDLSGAIILGNMLFGIAGNDTSALRGRMHNITMFSATQTQAQLEVLVA